MKIELEKEELFMMLQLIRGRVGTLIQMSAAATEISTDIRAKVQKLENLGKKSKISFTKMNVKSKRVFNRKKRLFSAVLFYSKG